MENPFQHTPLSGKRSIRVLKLHPGKASDPLSGELVEVSLDDTPVYEALSYAWESDTLGRPITCHGKQLGVTANCGAALLRLRHRYKTRSLWVDAICIDQSASAERGHQVSMMGDVYRNAERVLVWLGEGTEETDYVFRILKRIHATSMVPPPVRKWVITRILKKPLAGVLAPFHLDTAMRLSWFLDCVFDRSYYKRVWTVQEFAMATEAVILCGKNMIDWISLFTVRTIIKNCFNLYRSELAVFWRLNLHEKAWEVVRSSFGTIEPLDTRLPKSMRQSSVLPLRTWYAWSFLRQLRYVDSTDPKDKIYALHAILTTLGMTLPEPDYSRSFEEVYTQITRAAVEHDGSLYLLLWSGGLANPTSMPSWVPDYRLRSEYVALALNPMPSAAGTSERRFSFDKDGIRLSLLGTTVSSLRDRVASYRESDAVNFYCAKSRSLLALQSFLKILSAAQSQLRMLDQFLAPDARESGLMALATTLTKISFPEARQETVYGWLALIDAAATDVRTMILDLNHVINCEYSTPADGFLSISKVEVLVGKSAFSLIDRLNRHPAMELIGALPPSDFAVFVTDSGAVGVARPTIQAGDEVCLFSGLDHPVIVRKDGDNYRWVSEAWVNGIMQGEAWPDDEAVLREFTII